MAEPTLEDIFGAGAVQTTTTVTIQKASLPMTAAATNKAETILAAIAKKASASLTPASFTANTDQSISIASGFSQLVYRSIGGVSTAFMQSVLTFNFAKIQPSTEITPDDY